MYYASIYDFMELLAAQQNISFVHELWTTFFNCGLPEALKQREGMMPDHNKKCKLVGHYLEEYCKVQIADAQLDSVHPHGDTFISTFCCYNKNAVFLKHNQEIPYRKNLNWIHKNNQNLL